MRLSATTHSSHNRQIRLPRDTRPLFLTGKDGLLSLPTSVDFRPLRNEAPAVVAPASPQDDAALPAVGASLSFAHPRALAVVGGVCLVFWFGVALVGSWVLG